MYLLVKRLVLSIREIWVALDNETAPSLSFSNRVSCGRDSVNLYALGAHHGAKDIECILIMAGDTEMNCVTPLCIIRKNMYHLNSWYERFS